MSAAADLNRILAREAPALARMLSERGRGLAFPQGIPFQAAQARAAEINATIGQLTDGRGGALPLPGLARRLVDLDPSTSWLYAPISGPDSLRRAWVDRQKRLAGDLAGPCSLPLVTHGLAHAVSLIAGLVSDADLDLVVPEPSWENYDLVFDLQGASRMLRYPFFGPDRRFNLDGLARCLDGVRSKAVVVLNFPNNPTGYAPTLDEVREIAALLASHPGPLLVLVDDAYQGWVYDDTRERRSPFWELARVADPERMIPFKVDGATKELVFFSARIGFVTTSLTGAAEAALEDKLKCLVRGTVGCAPGPSLALVQAALADPELEAAFEERRQLLGRRAHALQVALDGLTTDRLEPYPFHGAFFALAKYHGDAEALRQRLLADYSTGVIAFPETGDIRLAFCSLAEEAIPALVQRLEAAAST